MSNPLKPYGLERNPFILPRLTSVDPASEAVEPFYVDGFRALSSTGTLQSFLEKRRQAGKPAYILVRGRSGIGRTAAARHILKKYGTISGAKYMIVPQIQANSDQLSVLKSWLGDFAAALKDKLEPDWEKRLDALLDAPTFDATFCSRFGRFLGIIDSTLGVGDHPLAFGFCVDDPPEGFPHSSLVQEVFARVNTVVVVVVHTDVDEDLERGQETSADPLLTLFIKLANTGDGWIFPRAKLTVEDVELLATSCWQTANSRDPCPVQREAIEEMWGASPMTLSDVVKILAFALHDKARNAKGSHWPANAALKLTGEDLRRIADNLAYQHVYERALRVS